MSVDGGMMSGTDDTIEDVDALRQALNEARSEVEAVRQEMTDVVTRRETLQRSHEEALTRMREESNREVIVSALRAEAIRNGAHNPDDVVRLIDLKGIERGEDGSVVGVSEALQQARQERAYLFGEVLRPGYSSGTTVGQAAPRPGGVEPFNARAVSEADYETRKWQFLAQK
ncbi:phage scaffolding protein [Gluconobacter sp. Dm-74]|uniref:phage scaffolding protein n=1 Tax=Gluconobacter sp. Dm-74 TaxID=2799803 RepID=UPI0020137CE9|nr:phage scaffolding protein [Gluconobacter sp. Dm-74]